MAFGHPLLERYFAEGDEEAFAAVVAAYLPLAFSAAVRITRDRSLSEEIAQTVFARLAGLRQGLPPGLCLATWLHRTTRTTALNLLRSERRRQRREEIAASLAMNESRFPWEKISPVLDEVIEKLSPQDRELVLSRFFLGESSEDLARRLGLGHEAVRKRLQRALGRLRDHLSHRGIRTTTAALALSLPAYGVETMGAALPAAVASAAVSAPLAPSPFTLLAAFVMKQSVAVSAIAILAAGSFWIVSEARAATALEGKIATLRQRIAAAEAGGRPARTVGLSGQSTAATGPIDWRHFIEMRIAAGDDVAVRRLNLEMGRRLAEMPAYKLSAELDRLRGLGLKEGDQLEIEALLLGHLGEKDPALALHHLEDQLADDRMTHHAFEAFRKWLAQDPQAATAWLDAQVAAGKFETRTLEESSPTRKWLEASLLPHLLESDPAAAAARLLDLPPDQRTRIFHLAEIPSGAEAAALRVIGATLPEADRLSLIREVAGELIPGGLAKISEFLAASDAPADARTAVVAIAFHNHLLEAGPDFADRLRAARDFALREDPSAAPRLAGQALGDWAAQGNYDQAVALLREGRPTDAAGQAVAAFLETPGVVERAPRALELLPEIADLQVRETLRGKLEIRLHGDSH